jgi:hypothetical protein
MTYIIDLLSIVNKKPWSYGSWMFNYLYSQCLLSLTLRVRISLRRGVLNTTLCDKFISDLLQVGGFLRVLQYAPSIKLTTTQCEISPSEINYLRLQNCSWTWFDCKDGAITCIDFAFRCDGSEDKSAGFNLLVHYHLYIPSSQSNLWNVIILTFINEIYKTLLPKEYLVHTVQVMT